MAGAQRLAVHRNTLTHRVQRIEALCGLTLDNAYDRLDIAIALMIWRLTVFSQEELAHAYHQRPPAQP